MRILVLQYPVHVPFLGLDPIQGCVGNVRKSPDPTLLATLVATNPSRTYKGVQKDSPWTFEPE